jgi:hypothetical protein
MRILGRAWVTREMTIKQIIKATNFENTAEVQNKLT